MAKKTFTLDNKSSADFGLFINGRGVYDSPEPDLEYLSVPGRSGDLIYDNKRFRNIEIVYPACFMLDNFKTNFKAVQAWILSHKGYFRLTDDYLPDYFRMASISRAISLDEINWVYDAGSFDLTFNCKPQLYLLSGYNNTYDFNGASGTTLNNPTLFAAKPLLKVYGAGPGSFTINDVTVSIASNPFGYIEIDCELMDCVGYTGSFPSNANSYVTVGDKFPELKPGNNTITVNNLSDVNVRPNWWTV